MSLSWDKLTVACRVTFMWLQNTLPLYQYLFHLLLFKFISPLQSPSSSFLSTGTLQLIYQSFLLVKASCSDSKWDWWSKVLSQKTKTVSDKAFSSWVISLRDWHWQQQLSHIYLLMISNIDQLSFKRLDVSGVFCKFRLPSLRSVQRLSLVSANSQTFLFLPSSLTGQQLFLLYFESRSHQSVLKTRDLENPITSASLLLTWCLHVRGLNRSVSVRQS